MKSMQRQWLAWPAILYLIVLFVIPTTLVLGFSLLERDVHGGVLPKISWASWDQALDRITLRALGRTLLLSALVTLADLALGYPCAAALARLPRSWRQAAVFAFCFPLVTSLLLRTYGWMNLLPNAWLGTFGAVALVLTFNYLPFMVLPLLRAFERADPVLELAAMDLGATPWQAFWRVTFPITRSGMWAGAALVFIPVTGEYLAPHFIGSGQVTVIGTVIWKEFDHRNWPYAAACATWLVGIVALMLAVAAIRSAVASRDATSASREGEGAAQ
jgi:ABC-type spermidine/putrescine transport system permease subunit I